MTTLDESRDDAPPRPEPTPPRRGPVRAILAFLRNTWRGLTAMRTALILLFLLALGALPGALLPQWSLNTPKVQQYIAAHGWWGRLLDRLQFFGVYGSVWFSAIYVLLFVSLVGCLLPRSLEYVRQFAAKPVLTPRNLARLPHHTRAESDADPADAIAAARRELHGWRMVEREEPNGARSLSAERGFLRETGNLVFHFAMLGLIVAFALGKMFSYSGQVIVLANGTQAAQFCNSGVFAYDSFTPGLRVDGTHLAPFCIQVDNFTASYQPSGEPLHFAADIQYQSGNDLDTGTWRPYTLAENEPLRTVGDRVYLLGHGYAPQFTVTFPDGQQRTGLIQWKPDDQNTFLSEGATKFPDPPGATTAARQHTDQLAITGLFAPTAVFQGGIITSVYPALRNPMASVDIYKGDLGTGAGSGQTIFDLDQNQIANGQLKKVDSANLRVGDSVTLPDGTKVRFDQVQQWVSLMVAHDPTQDYVLMFALLLLAGLIVSLTVKRRRVWVRATPAEDTATGHRTVVDIGGLARTDQAGYGEEFVKLSARLSAAVAGAVGKDT